MASGTMTTKKPKTEEGAPLWVVTYGDMMSLLLTFFIILARQSGRRGAQPHVSVDRNFTTGNQRATETTDNPTDRKQISTDHNLPHGTNTSSPLVPHAIPYSKHLDRVRCELFRGN